VFTQGAPEKALKKINQAVLQREFPNEEEVFNGLINEKFFEVNRVMVGLHNLCQTS
jgi:hypothetical protein